MSYYEYPKTASGGSLEIKVKELNSYLFRLVDMLNHNADKESPAMYMQKALDYYKADELSGGGITDLAQQSGYDRYMKTFDSLRDLIISNAEKVVAEETEPIVQKFEGKYDYLSSQFGSFRENIVTTITQSTLGERITSLETDMTTNSQGLEALRLYAGYIKLGWLEDSPPYRTWGIDVGKLASSETYKIIDRAGNVQEINNISTQQFIRIQPDRLSFMYHHNGEDEEVAYISEDSINFPNANITGGTINIGVIGQDEHGNDIYNFSVDSNGNVIARSLSLVGTTIPVSQISGMNAYAQTSALNSYVSKNGTIEKIGTSTIGSLPASGATSSNSTGFRLNSSGLLEASNAVIYGSIYAGNGYIGEWQINSYGIKNSYNDDIDVGNASANISFTTALKSGGSVFLYAKTDVDLGNGSTEEVYSIKLCRNGSIFANRYWGYYFYYDSNLILRETAINLIRVTEDQNIAVGSNDFHNNLNLRISGSSGSINCFVNSARRFEVNSSGANVLGTLNISGSTTLSGGVSGNISLNKDGKIGWIYTHKVDGQTVNEWWNFIGGKTDSSNNYEYISVGGANVATEIRVQNIGNNNISLIPGSGTVSITGAASLSGALNVSGATTLSGGVSGNISLNKDGKIGWIYTHTVDGQTVNDWWNFIGGKTTNNVYDYISVGGSKVATDIIIQNTGSSNNIRLSPGGKAYYGSVSDSNEIAKIGALTNYLQKSGGDMSGHISLNNGYFVKGKIGNSEYLLLGLNTYNHIQIGQSSCPGDILLVTSGTAKVNGNEIVTRDMLKASAFN